MKVTVVRPDDIGPSEAAIWARLQAGSQLLSSPFFSLGFAKTVGRFRAEARVAVVEQSGSISAFLPYERRAGAIGWPIGAPMNDLNGFVGPSGDLDAREVVRRAGLRGWRFEHAPLEQLLLVPHRYRGTVVECPVIELPGGERPYVEELGSATRRSVGRQRRIIRRDLGEISLQWSSSDRRLLAELVAWRSARYDGSRQLFARPDTRAILEVLADSEDPACRGVLSALWAGDTEIAVHFGMAGARGLTAWFLGFRSEAAALSPGLLMLLEMAREAAARGYERIDLGYGQHEYKFRIANSSYPVMGGAVWALPLESRARGLYRRIVQREAQAGPTGLCLTVASHDRPPRRTEDTRCR